MSNSREPPFKKTASLTISSAIVAEAEAIRQRHKRLQPKDALDDEKDYKTIVHTLPLEKLQAIFKTTISEDRECRAPSVCGLTKRQVAAYFEYYGKNRIPPPEKENKWIKLLKQMFCGIFNILLWFCVVAEVSLIIIFAKKPCHKGAHAMDADVEEADTECKEGEDADYVTPIILSAVIVMAALLQWKAEQAADDQMEAMQKMQAVEPVQVVRIENGRRVQEEVDPENLVPGDIVFIKSGDRVPADVRILSCTDSMEVDNSALTGESMPEPRTTATSPESMGPMEASNLAFFGTTVLKGNATCVVHATGEATFLGKIARGINTSRVKSTLEHQIEHFVHIIAFVAILIGTLSIICNMNSAQKRTPAEILQNAAAALFAQVPEGLLPTVTISLMIASSQMVKRNVLVRKIDAVETLGCVSVFCSDKTGTLTKGEMTVQDFIIPKSSDIARDGFVTINRLPGAKWADNPALNTIKTCGILNNGAETVKGEADVDDEGYKWTGSPTDIAILRACSEVNRGASKVHDSMQKTKMEPQNATRYEIPFNSTNKWMLTIHAAPGARNATLILKGAPDRVFEFCEMKDNPAIMAKVKKEMSTLMGQARRVLAVAKREIPVMTKYEGSDKTDCNFPVTGLEFVGLYGIEDPPKEGVDTAVLKAQSAGVKVVMVTGDHPDTARAIAKRINILRDVPPINQTGGKDLTVVTGVELEDKVPSGDNFGDHEPGMIVDFWTRATQQTRVFARVSPIHKQVIVQAYQKYGYGGYGDICAMTGDGVNDAPALKQAEVGVAMGIRGTAVAKDAADIVLQDDNFPSVIAGIEQGRLSSENLQKSIMYTLCSKIPQVAPTFAELLGIPPALTVAQVLLIDIGTDIWTAIAYALQPAESKLMERPPRHPALEKLVNWKVLVYSYLYIGQIQMMFCWIFFFYPLTAPRIWTIYQHPGDWDIQGDRYFEIVTVGKTVYYWTLVLGQVGAAISTTTKTQSVFGFFGYPYCFPNCTLNLMFVLEVLLSVAAIYNAKMNSWFNTCPLSSNSMLIPCLTVVGICFIEEVRKLIVRVFIDDSGSGDTADEDEQGTPLMRTAHAKG